MHVATLFKDILKEGSGKEALVFGGKDSYTYKDLGKLISKYQKLLVRNGVRPGDKVIFMTGLSAELYAGIIATLGLGAGVLMIEPWMPNSLISKVVAREKPRFYVILRCKPNKESCH